MRSPLYDELKARVPIADVIGADLQLHASNGEHVGLCPFHQEKTPSFTVSPAKAFYHCFGCGASGDVIDWLERYRNLSHGDAVAQLSAMAGLSSGLEEQTGKGKGIGSPSELWRRSKPGNGLVRAYLAARGLELDVVPSRLRQVDDLAYMDGRTYAGDFPCMVAPIVLDLPAPGAALDPVAVHRTYLAPGGEGKADVKVARKVLGAAAGGFIPLSDPRDGDTLALVEGVEDAISVALATGLPVWATVSAGNMSKVVRSVPPNVRKLRVFADGDNAGQKAAAETVAAWRAARGQIADVVVVTPDPGCKDANEMYRRLGAQGLRVTLKKAEEAAQRDQHTGGGLVVAGAEWLTEENLLPAPEQLFSDFLDVGGKCLVFGPSKARKSFFALQLGLSLAGGAQFLDMHPVQPRRVLMVQPEIVAAHYQRRSRGMFYSVYGPQADPVEQLADRWGVVNCKQSDPVHMLHAGTIADLALHQNSEVIVIDPVYSFLETGMEDSVDFRGLIRAVNKVSAQTGAAVILVHHYGKGSSGDRSTIDRGAGSGWLQRDMDAGLFLTPHQNDDYLVLERINRNYKPRAAVTIKYDDLNTRFAIVDGVAAKVQTTHRGRTPKPPISDEAALTALRDRIKLGPLSSTEARKLVEGLGSQADGREVYNRLIAAGKLKTSERSKPTQPQLVGLAENEEN